MGIEPVTCGLNESLPRLRCLPSRTRSHYWGGCVPPRSAIRPLTWPFTVGPAGIEPATRGLKGRSVAPLTRWEVPKCMCDLRFCGLQPLTLNGSLRTSCGLCADSPQWISAARARDQSLGVSAPRAGGSCGAAAAALQMCQQHEGGTVVEPTPRPDLSLSTGCTMMGGQSPTVPFRRGTASRGDRPARHRVGCLCVEALHQWRRYWPEREIPKETAVRR